MLDVFVGYFFLPTFHLPEALFAFVVSGSLTILAFWIFPLRSKALAIALGALACTSLLATAAIYTFSNEYLDHVEPSIAAVSWGTHNGFPIYHADDAAARYAWPYGPMLFILNRLVMEVLGPSVVTSKVGGFASLLLAFAITAYVARKYGLSAAKLAGALALFCGVCAIFAEFSYWDRPEPFILAAQAILILVATLTAGPVTAIAAGALCGIIVNLKITSVAFCAVPCLYLFLGSERRWRDLGFIAFAFVVAAALPFVSPLVSLRNYATEMIHTSGHGLNIDLFKQNLALSVLICLPVACAVAIALARRAVVGGRLWPTATALPLVAVLVAIPASKSGAGPHHLLPLLPTAIWLFAALDRAAARSAPISKPQSKFAAFGFLLVVPALWVATSIQANVLNNLRVGWNAAYYMLGEVKNIASDADYAPAQVVARDWPFVVGKTVPVFLGQPFVVDTAAVMDFDKMQIPFGAAFLQHIENCATKTFLFQAGVTPFTDASYYTNAPMYGNAVRAAFHQHYEKTAHKGFYDVWVCKKA